jgi:hypothetical protein
MGLLKRINNVAKNTFLQNRAYTEIISPNPALRITPLFLTLIAHSA